MTEEAAGWTSPVRDVFHVKFNPPKDCWVCCSLMGF